VLSKAGMEGDRSDLLGDIMENGNTSLGIING